MSINPDSLTIPEWVESLLQKGRIAFSIEELRQKYPDYSDAALKLILNRLFKKKKALSIHKGFYLIIAPQYASRGILPPLIDKIFRTTLLFRTFKCCGILWCSPSATTRVFCVYKLSSITSDK